MSVPTHIQKHHARMWRRDLVRDDSPPLKTHATLLQEARNVLKRPIGSAADMFFGEAVTRLAARRILQSARGHRLLYEDRGWRCGVHGI